MSYAYQQESFINRFGNMSVEEFVEMYHFSILDMYKGRKETIESFTYRESKSCEGYTHFILFWGRDDANYTEIYRPSDHIEIVTKQNGESRSWLEIGTIKVYHYQNGQTFEKWIKDELRYPQRDRRLAAGRYFIDEYVYWKMNVALDYPLTIRLVSRGPIIKNSEVDTTERTIWAPKQL